LGSSTDNRRHSLKKGKTQKETPVTLLFPEQSLTADLHKARPRVKPRPRRDKHLTIIAAALGFLGVLLLQAVPDAMDGDDASAQETLTEQGGSAYAFVVYPLNHTSRSASATSTIFTFDTGQLPFTFPALEFDEFRGDTEFRVRYYAGMSLLAWASGTNSTVEFREVAGELIEEIAYQGQPLVVLNGWETTSRDSKGKVIDNTWGSMQIAAYDWRDGLWSPEEGIVIEHLAGLTVSSARLCVMVYEPAESAEIPEFCLMIVCAAMATTVIILRRTKV